MESKKMTGIKSLVGRKMTKKVKFMDTDVMVSKLSVAEVMEIQDQAKDLKDNEKEGFGVLKKIIKTSVEGGDQLSDEDFDNFPLDELSKLSNEIMFFSGIGEKQGK